LFKEESLFTSVILVLVTTHLRSRSNSHIGESVLY
jgi:hypothetical protein